MFELRTGGGAVIVYDPRHPGHVIELIHLPDGRFTIDCRSRDHGPETAGRWFYMNASDETEAGRIIAAHRRQWIAPSTLGERDG